MTNNYPNDQLLAIYANGSLEVLQIALAALKDSEPSENLQRSSYRIISDTNHGPSLMVEIESTIGEDLQKYYVSHLTALSHQTNLTFSLSYSAEYGRNPPEWAYLGPQATEYEHKAEITRITLALTRYLKHSKDYTVDQTNQASQLIAEKLKQNGIEQTKILGFLNDLIKNLTPAS